MKRKILLMTTFVSNVVFALNAFATTTITDSGSCGETCTWSVDSDGNFNITGSGDMADYPYYMYGQKWYYTTPWQDYTTNITSLTIDPGITSITRGAFVNMTGVTSVTIPNSVTSIGEAAFSGMTGVTSVTIPNSVTSIGQSAFSGMTGVTSLTIPNSVTSIGGAAFSGMTGVTSLIIPNGVTSIGAGAFSGMTGVTSLTIPNSVTSIGTSAFSGMTGLTDLTIPDTAALEEYRWGMRKYDPFTGLDLANITLHCAGALEQCQANMLAAGYNEGTYTMVQGSYSKKNNDGSTTEYNYDADGNFVSTLVYNSNDGSIASYDFDGNLIALKGKRIYTVDEANKVSGDKNRVSIKYK